MKIYLAGPMSGIPGFNIAEFDLAALRLRELGFEVVSPAEVDGQATRKILLQSKDGSHADLPEGEAWSYYLARDFRIIADEGIEAIVTLPDWETSRGARCEVAMANAMGIERYDYNPTIGISPDPDSDIEGQFSVLEPEPFDSRILDGLEEAKDGFGFNPETVQYSPTGGAKDNRQKVGIDQLPVKPLFAAAEVADYGGRKYTPMNWRKGLSWQQQGGSMLRHIMQWLDGEDIDPESGLHHLAHAVTQALYTLEFVITNTGEDDRYSSQPTSGPEADADGPAMDCTSLEYHQRVCLEREGC